MLTGAGRPPWDLIRGKVLFRVVYFFLIALFHHEQRHILTSVFIFLWQLYFRVVRHFDMMKLNAVSYFHIRAVGVFIKHKFVLRIGFREQE